MMPRVILVTAPQASANVRWNQRPLASSANASAIGNVDELTEPWWGDIATTSRN